jgi:hypothetical protein
MARLGRWTRISLVVLLVSGRRAGEGWSGGRRHRPIRVGRSRRLSCPSLVGLLRGSTMHLLSAEGKKTEMKSEGCERKRKEIEARRDVLLMLGLGLHLSGIRSTVGLRVVVGVVLALLLREKLLLTGRLHLGKSEID